VCTRECCIVVVGGCIPARILFFSNFHGRPRNWWCTMHYSEISTRLEISAGFGVALVAEQSAMIPVRMQIFWSGADN
jgi:hypothetical protein